MTELRIWAEDLEPENMIRFTWQWTEPSTSDTDEEAVAIASALTALDGISSAIEDGEGVVVEFDPALVTRPGMAAAIREALGASKPEPPKVVDETKVRVWAEDLSDDTVRLTWKAPDRMGDRDLPADRRRVTAWLAIQPEVRSARIDGDGVLVRYVPEEGNRRKLAGVVRVALAVEEDLRTRANALIKRAPTYGNLASKLAMDERISPIPDAARQAMAGRGSPATNLSQHTALRFIPGGALILRIQNMLPVIQALMTWSREAPPDVVEEHLAAAGLDRATLEADNATAQEARLFVRDYAGEKASELSERAATGARKAIDFGREWIESRRAMTEPTDAGDNQPAPDSDADDDAPASQPS